VQLSIQTGEVQLSIQTGEVQLSVTLGILHKSVFQLHKIHTNCTLISKYKSLLLR